MKTILYYVDLNDMSTYFTQMFYVNTEEALREAGYDVIVTNKIKDAYNKEYDGFLGFFFKRAVAPAIIAKMRGKKVFLTGGLDDLDRNNVSFVRFITQVVTFKIGRWFADGCLIESHSDLENINNICFKKEHKNLFYSPQGINMSLYDCSLDNKEKLFSTICWMGIVDNVKRKGCDIALYYFKKFRSHPMFRDYKFVVMGKGEKGREYLEKIVNDLELGEYVIFTGQVTEKEKIDWLKRSKYFFQLSKMEGFGLAALESLAAKCIPIHTTNGGLKDTMADDGVVVDTSDFDYELDTIDDTCVTRLLEVSDKDIISMHRRIVGNFDSKKRVERFKEILSSKLN